MPHIMLDIGQIARADKTSIRSHISAMAKKRPPKNGAPNSLLASLRMHRVGTRTEMAGWLFCCRETGLDLTWNEYAESLHGLADIEDWIDVKGISNVNHRLILQKDDPDQWAYLLVSSHAHPRYEILGWVWGKMAKKSGITDPSKRGRPAYFVDRGLLRPVEELVDGIKWRSRQESNPRAAR